MKSIFSFLRCCHVVKFDHRHLNWYVLILLWQISTFALHANKAALIEGWGVRG